MSSPYPSGLRTYPDVRNHIDVYDESHINDIHDDVIALQTYVGTNPQGSKADLVARLAVMISTSGVLYVTTGTISPSTPGQLYFRSDSETLFIINSVGSPQAIGASFSNKLFEYAGVVNTANEVNASSIISTNPITYRFLRSIDSASIYATLWTTRWKKLSGVNTITPLIRLWTSTGPGSTKALCRLTVGTITGTAAGSASKTNPEWAVGNALDVSGLNNGTYYDVVFESGTDNIADYTLYSNLIGFGS